MTVVVAPSTSSWVEQASCRGKPIDWWYPAPGDSFSGQVALQVCKSCPVREPCLDEALELEAGEGRCFGVRGGLRPSERVALLCRRRQLAG